MASTILPTSIVPPTSIVGSFDPTPPPLPPGVGVGVSKLEEFQLIQVYLIPVKGGRVLRREIPVTFSGPKALEASTAYGDLKTRLEVSGKTVSHLDIVHMTVTYAGSDQSEKMEYNEFVQKLRDLYNGAAYGKDDVPHAWPDYRERSRGNMSSREPFLLPASERTKAMSKWSRETVIEKLSVQMPNRIPERTAQTEKMERVVIRLSSGIEAALQQAGLSEERKDKLLQLKGHIESHSPFALYSDAFFHGDEIDVVLEALRKAVKAEQCDLKEGPVGAFFQRRHGSPTFEEESWLRDVALLGPKTPEGFIDASHKLGRPVTQDGIEAILTGAFDVTQQNITNEEMIEFFAHPMIAALGLDPVDINAIQEKMINPTGHFRPLTPPPAASPGTTTI